MPLKWVSSGRIGRRFWTEFFFLVFGGAPGAAREGGAVAAGARLARGRTGRAAGAGRPGAGVAPPGDGPPAGAREPASGAGHRARTRQGARNHPPGTPTKCPLTCSSHQEIIPLLYLASFFSIPHL